MQNSTSQFQTSIAQPGGHWLGHYDRHEARSIVRLSTPIALVAMINMAMSITDTFMVAKLGHQAIAAVAVGSDYNSIFLYMGAGFLAGLTPAYAEAWNLQDRSRLARLRAVGWMLLCIAAIPTVPIVWFAPDYLRWFGVAPELLEQGRGYTRAMSLTLIPMLIVTYYRNRLTALEKPQNILKVTLVAIPLNAGLNWILIFGMADWGGLGVTGAGVSSLLTTTLIAIGLSWLAHCEGDFGLTRKLDMSELVSALRIGWPIGIATLAEVGIFLCATLYVAAIAPADAAAHALALRMAGFVYAIPVGLLQASMVRIARLGASGLLNSKKCVIASATSVAFMASVFLSIGLCAIAFPLSELLLGGTVESAPLVETAAMLILMIAVIEVFEPLGTTSAGLLRGLKDTQLPMVYSLVGNWGISLPIGLALSLWFDLGAIGVWIGMGIGNITASALLALRVKHHWQGYG